ncbi:SGNH/GDSL hydrolase family protein [Limibacter armeniacum]|uniref:SGNH/GDSL hydrolase family protein n=1 Tax=Limibacter armeniacum TaxID=466084 RepID=UPI002FE66D2D
MKKYFKFSSKGWLLGIMTLFACETDIDVLTPTNNGTLPNGTPVTLDFSNYIAIGNSLTAGYSDAALYLEAQQQSFPSIVAEQLMEVGLEDFDQPLMPDGGGANGGTGDNLQGRRFIQSFVNGAPNIQIAPPSTTPYSKVDNIEEIDNFGVPGLRLVESVIPGLGASVELGNPFYFRILPEESPLKTYQDLVVEQDPTFFTLWLGNNDVLGYATSGGVFGEEGIPEQAGLNGLTSVTTFQILYEGLVERLISDGETYGALYTIPDVTTIPFFTTIPWNSLVLDQATADRVNLLIGGVVRGGVEQQAVATVVIPQIVQGFVDAEVLAPENAPAFQAEYTQAYLDNPDSPVAPENSPFAVLYPSANAALDQTVTSVAFQEQIDQQTALFIEQANQLVPGAVPEFVAGANPLIVLDEESPTGFRSMISSELVLLTASGKLQQLQEAIAGAGTGGITPEMILSLLPDDEDFLDTQEVLLVRNRSRAFNQIIIDLTIANDNLVLVDVASVLAEAAEMPISEDGVTLSATFISGGAFSLDGTHLTPRGYAFIANETIKAINKEYGTRIPVVSLSQYRGVEFP